jgi:hypothetical protein
LGVGLVFATEVSDGYTASDWKVVLFAFGAVPWGIAGAVTHGRKAPTVWALSAAVIGFFVGMAFYKSNEITGSLGIGGGLGLVVGAIAGAAVGRRGLTAPAAAVDPAE